MNNETSTLDRKSISVTQADIDAKGMCDGNCPIARAVVRTYALDYDKGEFVRVSSRGTVSIFALRSTTRQIDCFYLDLPGEATGFISRYDRGESVQPFTFTLNGSYSYESGSLKTHTRRYCSVANI